MEKLKRHFILSNIFAFLGAFSLLCIVFLRSDPMNDGSRLMPIAIAVIFWSSLILEMILIMLLGFDRKRLEHKPKVKSMGLGLISFFKTPIGKMADMMLVCSLFVLLVAICFNVNDRKLVIPVLSVLYLSMHLHCIYNGRNYRFLRAYLKHNKEKYER